MTTPNLATWKPILLENAITPMQQYAYTSGKNSTDSAMIIDAMDILYSGRIDGFVLVSSDSDFTRLAVRLREAGMKVYGMGEKKTPALYRRLRQVCLYRNHPRQKRENRRFSERKKTVPGDRGKNPDKFGCQWQKDLQTDHRLGWPIL